MKKIKHNYSEKLAHVKLANHLKNYLTKDTIIVCIGTDRCIGDALGPLVGTYLIDKNFPLPVFGTISDPIHALNIEAKLNSIRDCHMSKSIIAIDACLGDYNNVGEIQIRDYPISPGKGVGKSLPEIGDISIIGIVDSSDSNLVFTSRNIRLNLIFNMASVISDSLLQAYTLLD